MSHVESLRAALGPTMRMNEADKRRVREELVQSYLPAWAAGAERQLGDGPFVAGEKLHVVDLKIWSVYRWIASGKLDHIPATLFTDYLRLTRVHDAVRDHAAIRAWYAKA